MEAADHEMVPLAGVVYELKGDQMTNSPSLIPLEERDIDFYGESITALVVAGDPEAEIFVALRPLCDYLGLSWSGQFERLKRDAVLGAALQFVRVTRTKASRGDPNTLCLPLEYLPGWLFGISVGRVRPALQEKITRYRRECFRVLWRSFQADALAAISQRDRASLPQSSDTANLMHIRELGLAVAQMADQQLALEYRVVDHDGRLDRAAIVIKEVQRQITTLEEHVGPAHYQYIDDAQASDVANLVRAIAKDLSERDKSKNHYQSASGELYRRFRVNTYKLIRRDQYSDVVTFLNEWHLTIQTS
ncbi:MAG: hypothetical protein NVS2B7_18020 [Herpetosiphon sp.]